MVLSLQKETSPRESRIREWLREADLPGEDSDVAWVSEGLHQALTMLDPHEEDPHVEALLTMGLLQDLGLQVPEGSSLLEMELPDSWLRAVSPLLRSGFAPQTWRLVECGVLDYRGPRWGELPEWVLDGRSIRPLLEEWYELGETLIFRTLARGLLPLLMAEERIQVRLVHTSRKEGKAWLQALQQALASLSPEGEVLWVLG